MPAATPRLHWPATDTHAGGSAQWHSSRGEVPPAAVRRVDDRMPADSAFRLAEAGCALLWQGDFVNARHLLQALARRADRPPRTGRTPPAATPAEAFFAERRRQARRATLLGRLTILLEPDYAIALPRAPDWRTACTQAWGPPGAGDGGRGDGEAGGHDGGDRRGDAHAAPLTELLGAASAAEWRRVGVELPELGRPPGNRIHPHHGVFSPVRGEYLSLVAGLPWPGSRGDEGEGEGEGGRPRTGGGGRGRGVGRHAGDRDPGPSRLTAFDIGTGTGVLAALLARRGVGRVVATDIEPRAVACARDNIARLGLDGRVAVECCDGFPDGRADLVVCNPPWLPVDATTPLERAVYDPGGAMLAAFLAALPAHLTPGGEGWLVMSDLAERLGLRAADALPRAFAAAGLRVLGRHDTRPRHPRARDAADPLHAARAAEVTSLWRLAAA